MGCFFCLPKRFRNNDKIKMENINRHLDVGNNRSELLCPLLNNERKIELDSMFDDNNVVNGKLVFEDNIDNINDNADDVDLEIRFNSFEKNTQENIKLLSEDVHHIFDFCQQLKELKK
jgi:hypothetical protein